MKQLSRKVTSLRDGSRKAYKRGSLSAFSHMDTPQSGGGGGWRLQSDFAFRSLFKAFDTFDDFQVLIKMADSHQNCQHH